MSENNLAKTLAKITNTLESLDPETRMKVLQAAFALYGDGALAQTGAATQSLINAGVAANHLPTAVSEQNFFGEKAPRSHVEKLAVAARYRESHGHKTHSKKEIEEFFKAAQENFDSHNYTRNMGHAKEREFFTRGNKRDEAMLSSYGQKFVDALPKRGVASGLQAPRKPTKKKKKKQ